MLDTLAAMEWTTLAAFLAACLVLYLTPGADMMFTIASGAAGGPRAGVAAAAGISLGVVVHVVVAAAGLGAVVTAHRGAYDAIRWAGAAYLAYLAIVMWRAKPQTEPVAGAARMRRAFARGFVTNILNPKVGLFVLAFLPQFADPVAGPIWHQILWLGLILGIGGLLTDGAIGAAAGAFSGWLRCVSGLMNKLAALVFGGLAARLAID